MSSVALRLFIFTFFPVLLALAIYWIDRTVTTRMRRLETLLILLFAVSVAGNGIFNFFAHFFVADVVAAGFVVVALMRSPLHQLRWENGIGNHE